MSQTNKTDTPGYLNLLSNLPHISSSSGCWFPLIESQTISISLPPSLSSTIFSILLLSNLFAFSVSAVYEEDFTEFRVESEMFPTTRPHHSWILSCISSSLPFLSSIPRSSLPLCSWNIHVKGGGGYVLNLSTSNAFCLLERGRDQEDWRKQPTTLHLSWSLNPSTSQ